MAGRQWSALRCGARRANGLICRGRALANGRCKYHGGMVTPYHMRPISEAGKRRIGDAQRARWIRYRADRAATGKPIGRPRKPRELTIAEWYAEKRQRARDFLDPQKWGEFTPPSGNGEG